MSMRKFFTLSILAVALPAAGVSAAPAGPWPAGAASGWRVRDVTADTAFVAPGRSGAVPGLGLRLIAGRRRGAVWTSACTVVDATGRDRAVTLAFCVALDAVGWRWWDDPQRARIVAGAKLFANITEGFYGTLHMGSRYPLAVLDNGSEAVCLAAPLQPARAVRFVYDPAARELRAEFDFGLSPLPQRFPSRADAVVIAYRVPPQWAFRQALARYYDLFADDLRRRAGEGGTLLTKSPLVPIERPEDFFFTWHDFGEGEISMAGVDRQRGVQSFLYREPQTDWRTLREDGAGGALARTYENYLAQLEEDARRGDRESQAALVSAVVRADGRYDLYLEPIAWTTQAPFGLNASPDVPTTGYGDWPNKAQFVFERGRKLLGWNGAPTSMRGMFYDSMEGWGNLMNYRREHWRTTQFPLSFDRTNANRVCLFNMWGNVAFAKAISAALRSHGQLLMGNDAFRLTWYHMPFVDIPGREVTGDEADGSGPESDELYLFFRSMAGRRPFWTLLNDRYDDAGKIERYFQHSLFYGIFPSMFHAPEAGSPWYWGTPAYYDRDRPLFRKYVPLLRRLDKAGWEPVPWATVEPKTVRLERFGRAAAGNLAFTLHNTSGSDANVRLALQLAGLGIREVTSATEWLAGIPVSVSRPRAGGIDLQLKLPANGYAAIGVETDERP